MNTRICILDYGSGNVRSVFNILNRMTPNVIISNSNDEISAASHIILPGVGSFEKAMEKINVSIDVDFLKEIVLKEAKPFLGICVGMQVLADYGYEFGTHKGLGWVPGNIKKLETSDDLTLPHIGWNAVESDGIFSSINGLDFYFVHSYCYEASKAKDVAAKTEYGQIFPSIVARDNIWGVQFHPEKSQLSGMKLLKLFIEKNR
jgi:glutamine amidotransferase